MKFQGAVDHLSKIHGAIDVLGLTLGQILGEFGVIVRLLSRKTYVRVCFIGKKF